MTCLKCKQLIKREWIKISPSEEKLMWSCDCIVNSQASRQENGRVVHFASEPVAFFKTKEGETIGVDKKGNKLAPQDTRYDLKNDEHGWKAAGKVKSPRKHFI